MPLCGQTAFTLVQHHGDKYEQHHDGACVDNDLQCSGKRRAQQEENQRDGQHHGDQIQQSMYHIMGANSEKRRYDGDGSCDEKYNVNHGNRLLTLMGACSSMASPLALPVMALPLTL